MRALLWKEAREHALRFGVLLTLAVTAAMAFRWGRQSMLGSTIGELFTLCCWFVPAWIAASTVASEKSARTQRLLNAIPVAAWKIWTVKTAAGLVTMLVPVAAAAMLIQLGEEKTFKPFEIFGMLLALASIYLMTAALTLWAARETVAAIGGVIILLGLLLHISIGDLLSESISRDYFFWFIAPNPMAYLYYWVKQPMSVLGVQAGMAGMWWAVGLFLYPRFADARRSFRPVQAATTFHLSKRRPSRLRMLAWREMREQGGVILAAAVTGMLVAAIVTCVGMFNGNRNFKAMADFIDTLQMIAICVPPIVAVLLGISSWTFDLQPRLFEFWRSRPIPTAGVFWVKLAFSFLGVIALLACFVLEAQGVMTWSGATVRDRFAGEQGKEFVRDFLLMGSSILGAILATSIFVTILVRRPIAAGLVIVALIIAGGLGVGMLIEAAVVVSADGVLVFELLMVLAAVVMIGLARVAISRDWRVPGLSGV